MQPLGSHADERNAGASDMAAQVLVLQLMWHRGLVENASNPKPLALAQCTAPTLSQLHRQQNGYALLEQHVQVEHEPASVLNSSSQY